MAPGPVSPASPPAPAAGPRPTGAGPEEPREETPVLLGIARGPHGTAAVIALGGTTYTVRSGDVLGAWKVFVTQTSVVLRTEGGKIELSPGGEDAQSQKREEVRP